MGNDGAGCLRSKRSRVLRLTARSHAWPRRTPGPPAQRDAESEEALSQPEGAPGPGRSDSGQPFGEDAAWAVAIAAEPFAYAELQAHMILRPGQISQGAFVPAVDMLGRRIAQRTGDGGLRRAHPQGDLRRGVIDMTRLEAQPRGIG